MSRDKQMINDLIEIFDEEYGKRNLITPQNTAEKLSAKGYREASEVAREIFAELDEIFESFGLGYFNSNLKRTIDALKKKYTEDGELEC